jgi:hypothetical protein
MTNTPKITTWTEARAYLANLKGTVEGDIVPLLRTPGGAPFTVSRNVMSYHDHLGHLYSGKPRVGARFESFLTDIVSHFDPNYARRASVLYQMHRCGAVHEFAPKVLRNKTGQTLAWLYYRGARQEAIDFDARRMSVTHLVPVASAANRNYYWLPVSSDVLVTDLIASIERYATTGGTKAQIDAWNAAVDELDAGADADFTVP